MSPPSDTPDALSGVLAEVRPLADRFGRAGHRLYLVGGVVRDLMAGLGDAAGPQVDIDLTTDADPAEIERLLTGWADAVWTQGARFGTVGSRFGDRTYEITTHRAEVYVPDSRKPHVVFSTDVTEDLARRDFTVNAMARELPDGALVDPYGGADDLVARRLRTPLDPEVTFSEDPLRMVRAARFVASHELEPDPAVVAAMGAMAERMEIVATERIRAELDRLVVTERPSPGLVLLRSTGLLAYVLAEHATMDDGSWAELVERVDRTPADLVARLAVLLDGVVDAATGLRRLRSSNEQIGAVRAVRRALTVLGDEPGSGAEPGAWPTDAATRRFVAAAAGHTEAALAAVAGERGAPAAVALTAALERLAGEGELDDLGPQLDGAEVMALLGLPAGPQVGEALGFLQELRLAEGRLARSDLEDRLRVWLVSGQPGTSW